MILAWAGWLLLLVLAWYDRLARGLGWLAARDDFEQYVDVAKLWREHIWPALDHQVFAVLTWTDALFTLASAGLVH